MNRFILLNLFFACLANTSHYRGYAEVDNLIRGRILNESSTYSVSKKALPPPLFELLGAYIATDEPNATMSNSQPNSLSILLWHIVFKEFSIQVAMTCNDPEWGQNFFKSSFYRTVIKACEYPLTAQVDEDFLESLWSELMRFDAPRAEYEIWKTFLLNNYALSSGKELLKLAVLTAYMNPYFLLKD